MAEITSWTSNTRAKEVLGTMAVKGNFVAVAAIADVRLHDPCVPRAVLVDSVGD